MRFTPFVVDSSGNHIPVDIAPMTEADAIRTEETGWQTAWTSEYIQSSDAEKYAIKHDGELIGLGAYEVQNEHLVVHIIYMEAQPESNPTMDAGAPKYTKIGRLLIALGIKLSIDSGFFGDVVLEAKTTELYRHYVDDFGAIPLAAGYDAAPRPLIADNAARSIFFCYLMEEDEP